jgi:prepilin-type N-terminal cleavage/methylation domain-containing protein
MKKQSGFTLIELLLVLAIIGIISAIAIPALLSQRARARDKAAQENLTGHLGDLAGQYDKWREAGSTATAITAHLTSYLQKTAADKNPWNPAGSAFAAVDGTTVTGKTTTSDFVAGMTAPASQGKVYFYIQYPAGSVPGFIGGNVKLGNKANGSFTFAKATAIE